MSTAGAATASSISKAAAMPSASSCRERPNLRSMPPASASAQCWKTWCSTRIAVNRISTLAADAFGVMPPIAKLTPAQAMYHFLSGYTAKVAGTERGLGKEPQPEFSTCFGSPFLPRDPSVYGNLLRDLIARHGVDCWLVNTGWTGGKYGTGRRMPIKVTRALLTAALDGSLRDADFRTDKYFGFAVPTSLLGVEPHILDPVKTWADKVEFDKTARALVGMFQKNFAKFEAQVDAEVRAAAPEVKLAAE